ncbi:putative elongator complex protein 1 [Marasmius crinis-equi]|uniref:Elongator complex protein 1 n=1 Tax=Marasmius crinis-equi TaxID=585013 RepID=A0ABR3F0N2_9AGAR
MRNLTLSSSETVLLSGAHICATALDLDQNCCYAASQRVSPDGEVEVEIWKINRDENANPILYSKFSCIAAGSPSSVQLVSLRVIPENQRLIAITRGGDITSISLEDEEAAVEVEGTVDDGILAAGWSPDESLLVLITGDSKLILMTSTFDVLSEGPMETTEFGEDAPINVGWGSKQTQFHGSLGKAAAQTPTNVAFGSSPDDDTLPRDSNLSHRILRVYDRQGILQSTSEAVPGLEHTLAWKPSGNLIAGTQRFGFEGGGSGRAGRHDVVFFERNGLRHGEFELRPTDIGVQKQQDRSLKWGYKVRELSWNSESNIIAVWIERDEGDLAEIIRRTYGWETNSSISAPPIDSALVGVADGSSVLLTPFRTQNVPPPMSSYQLSLSNSASLLPLSASKIPLHTTFSSTSDILGVLWETGYFELWSLRTRLGPGRGKVLDPERIFSSAKAKEVQDGLEYRQIMLVDASAKWSYVALLGSKKSSSDVVVVVRNSGETSSIAMSGRNGRLVSAMDALLWQDVDGTLLEVDAVNEISSPVGQFSETCPNARRVLPTNTQDPLYIGLTNSGKLHVTARDVASRIIASNATSFTVASGYLIYTSSAHEAIFAPLRVLPDLLQPDEEGSLKVIPTDWEKRRVERGSRIVVPVPSAMSLVLQMPRGNLETINPRALVLEVVRQDLDSGQYRKAFLSCRKHRVDLNFLVEHNQEAFLNGLSSFVEQVHEVDHINLFLTSVGQGSQSPETIGSLCDSLRTQLEQKDLKKYVNSILTAHVVKSPPDHEAGLTLLLRLRNTDPSLVEDAVKYIIFLVDANKLFDTALGMYDFSLVLMIAQHSQRDPREYLPFLRELRALESYYQRFRIDDHLRRHASALRNLSLAGPSRLDEAIEYAERYQLYSEALKIWKGSEHYPRVLEVYGDWLYERREFRNAASVFVESGHLQKAMVAHEKALEWQELFDLAIRTQVSGEDLQELGYRVSEDLVSKKRFAEAARVLLDYVDDIRTAIITLVQGNEFSEARRIATLKRGSELVMEIIHPAALESRAQIAEDISEMREQLRKQLSRIRELRIKKIEEPDEFYGVEDTALHNVDVMTDVSMAPTAFTRYTVAPSTASRASKKSSRSKRKAERKVGSGRKGTVDEEEYLLKSVTKLMSRFNATKDEACKLLPHMLQFTSEHRGEGLEMQEDVDSFEREMKEAVDEIWTKTGGTGDEQDGQETTPAPTPDTWAARMEEVKRNQRINPVERIPKPELTDSKQDWKMKLLEMER